ncbi:MULTISPECIES: hypothetical protein [Streptomyces]|uniref:Pyridine nucleotide-disulfide oxidoreductase n=2 Tax=Streptomyces TaxID=1883 RepID=A0A117IXA8_9ACTN|nr:MULTISPECIES: hypothetical protein [Streptomyces]KUH40551.1 hypothetical protein ATE80_01285 [Streptomyces kanasensis]UUS33677.1 hypothetical protein NRO40_24530 [Streptomyces changanensis]
MIDENHVRELLDKPDDEAALVLMEGRAHVVGPTDLDSEPYRGAAVLVTRADLVERLGGDAPSPEETRAVASALRTATRDLGA